MQIPKGKQFESDIQRNIGSINVSYDDRPMSIVELTVNIDVDELEVGSKSLENLWSSKSESNDTVIKNDVVTSFVAMEESTNISKFGSEEKKISEGIERTPSQHPGKLSAISIADKERMPTKVGDAGKRVLEILLTESGYMENSVEEILKEIIATLSIEGVLKLLNDQERQHVDILNIAVTVSLISFYLYLFTERLYTFYSCGVSL